MIKRIFGKYQPAYTPQEIAKLRLKMKGLGRKGENLTMQDDIFVEIDSIKLDPLNKRYEINKTILSAICGQTGLTLGSAKAVLVAIVKGQIPNVTVNYGSEDKGE